jgi:hypothetical protein
VRAVGAGGSRSALQDASSRTRGSGHKPDYRALQPFGQVPILEENGLVLFESGVVMYGVDRDRELLAALVALVEALLRLQV